MVYILLVETSPSVNNKTPNANQIVVEILSPTMVTLIMIATIINFTLFTLLNKRILEARKVNNELRKINKSFSNKINKLENLLNRSFRYIKSDSEKIEMLRGQMDQVHNWLGNVLNVSNLTEKVNPEDEITIIEELRQRVKWAEEVEHYIEVTSLKIPDSEYYDSDTNNEGNK